MCYSNPAGGVEIFSTLKGSTACSFSITPSHHDPDHPDMTEILMTEKDVKLP